MSSREPQTAEVNILKENRSPFEKPKSVTDRTPPPRSRRLSIETSTVVKMEHAQANKPKEAKLMFDKTMTDRTPPLRSRRLSIETSSVVKMEKAQANKPKEPKSPFEKPKVVAERTPLLTRRLSIENCNTTNTRKTANLEVKKVSKTPSVQSRARRLSLEGPKYANKFSVNLERSGQPQAAEVASKPSGFRSNVGSSMDIYHHTPPKSPTNSACQSQLRRTESVTKIPSLQQPKTPEPAALARVEPHTLMESELMKPLKSQTSSTKTGTNGKASQIRKSLRAIGKLINGSEKRYVKFDLKILCILYNYNG